MYRKLPNILTVVRIALAPVFCLIYLSNIRQSGELALALFLIVGATDMLDGYLARKYNLITPFGTAMDPLADKIMLVSVFLCFAIKGILPLWLIVFVIVKELCMIFSGLYFYFRKEKFVIPSNILGKAGTMLMFIALVGLLADPNVESFKYMVYASVGLKIAAMTSYAKIVKKRGF